MRMLKSLFKKILHLFGYQISKSSERGWHPKYLNSLSDARVIVDIGAANGTPALYKAFEERQFILFEPLIEYQEKLESWKKKINCRIEYVALGNIDGEIPIQIDPRKKTMSSIVERSNLTKAEKKGVSRVVKMAKLDSILGNRIPKDQKLIIKIDVEGFELKVLEGAKESLKRTDLLIVETSIAELYKSDTSFLEVLKFMEKHGFKLFDILYMAYYKNWKGLMWADLVFVPKEKSYRYPI